MAGLVKLLLMMLGCVSAMTALAGDPTRPPAAWLGGSAEPVAGAPVQNGAPRLQSVLIPQRGKPVAVISGQTVALGERFGEARLVRLSEREAVLEGADGVTRLMLTPDVQKQLVTPKSRAAQKKETP